MARAFFASTIATILASALVYLNATMHLLPAADLISILEVFNQRIGLNDTSRAAWVLHLILGIAVFGFLFALLRPILPGHGTVQGLVYGAILWLAMMVAFMPLAQHEMFARDLGPEVAAIALGFNLIYGAVLGMCYAAFGLGDD